MKALILTLGILFSGIPQSQLHPYLNAFLNPLSESDLSQMLGEDYAVDTVYNSLDCKGNMLTFTFDKREVKKQPFSASLKKLRIPQELLNSKGYQENPVLGLTNKMDLETAMSHLSNQPGVKKLKESGDFGGKNIIFDYWMQKDANSKAQRVEFYIRVEKGKKKKYWIEFILVSDPYYH